MAALKSWSVKPNISALSHKVSVTLLKSYFFACLILFSLKLHLLNTLQQLSMLIFSSPEACLHLFILPVSRLD